MLSISNMKLNSGEWKIYKPGFILALNDFAVKTHSFRDKFLCLKKKNKKWSKSIRTPARRKINTEL